MGQQSATEAIRAWMREAPSLLRRARVPGLSLAVVQDAAIVWVGVTGAACLEPPDPVTTATIFQAASLSKPLFACAVLGLVERGQIDLDTSLTSYLPEPYVPNDPLLAAVTARHVLAHRTGWPNWRPRGEPLVRERAPGGAFGYSGEGYLYLQAVVEYLVGRPLDVYMQQEVLDPLGMHASSYRWATPGDPSIAHAHDHEGLPTEAYRADRPEAASSLHTTPSDFARFLCAMMAPTEVVGRLGAQRRAEMVEPQVLLEHAVAWGLGWGLEETKYGWAFWHWGDNPGYKSLVLAVPSRGKGIVIMTNGDAGLGLCADLVRAVIDGDDPALHWLATTMYQVPTLTASNVETRR